MNESDMPLFDEHDVLEAIDPEWRDHFHGEANLAIDFYRRYAHDDWERAIQETCND